MLRSDLCDYIDAYVVVKGKIYARATANTYISQKDSAFKNNAPFRSWITKISSKLIYNAEDLDIAMPMYNLLEYSQNYSMTWGSLCKYFRNKIDDADDNASDSKSFKYRTKIIGKKEEQPGQPALPPANPDGTQPPQRLVPRLNAEFTIPLKYLSNFRRSLDLSLINCKLELDL